jgi:O-antigen/teichoic acid export membrane protein
MRISKTFIRSSLIYTIAGALPMASAIILLPFYITYLTPSDFGALSVYFAFSLFLQIITTYSFDTSLYIHFHEFKNDKEKLSSFVSSAFVLMLLIGAVVGVLFIFGGDLIFRNVFADKPISFYPYGLMTAATGIFQALFKVNCNLLQSRSKPELFLWSNLTSFGLIAGFTIAGLELFPNTLIGPVGGRLLAAVLSGGWALLRIFREFGIHFNYPLLRSSFGFNFYSFIYQVLQWVINYLDRIILVFYVPLFEVGLYDFASKCLLAIEFVLNGLHNTFYPKVVSELMSQPEKTSTLTVNRYYHGFIAVIMVLICSSILIFPWAIELLVSKPEYRESIPYLPYIALLYVFRAMRLFFAVPYGILKYMKPLPVINAIVSAVKILLMLILIKRYGIYGVIAGSMVAAVIELVLLRYNIGGRFTFRYNFFKVVIAPLSVFLMVLVLEPFFATTISNLLHLFYVTACIVILGMIYRNEIRQLYQIYFT